MNIMYTNLYNSKSIIYIIFENDFKREYVVNSIG